MLDNRQETEFYPEQEDAILASMYSMILKADHNSQGANWDYSPSASRLKGIFVNIFDFARSSGQLDFKDMESLMAFIENTYNKLDEFKTTKLSRNEEKSNQISGSEKNLQVGEICRFRASSHIGQTPSAIVFYEDGKLKYKLGSHELEKEIFNIYPYKNNSQIEAGVIDKVEKPGSETIKKLAKVINSKEFLSSWAKFQSETLSNPKTNVEAFIKQAFEIPGNMESENHPIFLGKVSGLLNHYRNVIQSGKYNLKWQEIDKRAVTISKMIVRTNDFMIFGYVDGKGRFISAFEEDDVFAAMDNSGGLEVLFLPAPKNG